MKNFSISMISLMAMTGLAFAQAGAKVDAKAGAGVGAGSAAAGAKAGAGAAAGAGNAAGGAAKAGAGAATGAAGGAAAGASATVKMEMPKAPKEIADTQKMMAKPLTCTGTGMGPDMKTEAKFKGTVSSKLDMDGWWIRQSIKLVGGEGKNTFKMNMEQDMTWDAKAGKWRVMGISNDGGAVTGMADMKDGKYELVGDMSGAMGTAKWKDHGDMTDKKNIHFWGEASMDGKNWMKVYDMTCK
jgi:hypothetical protein